MKSNTTTPTTPTAEPTEVKSASVLFDVLTRNGKDYAPQELVSEVTTSLIDYASMIMNESALRGEAVLQESVNCFETFRYIKDRLQEALAEISEKGGSHV